MAYYTKETPQSEPRIIIDVDGEILAFCNDARDYLEILRNLYEALDDQQVRLENEPDSESKTESDSDKRLVYEIGIARTLLGLFAEKTKKLGRLATNGSEALGTMLRDIQQRLVGTERKQ